MSKFDDLKSRVRDLLEDPGAGRFSDTLLAVALRRALEDVDLQLPRLSELEVTVASSNRDQPLNGINNCRYIMQVDLPLENRAQRVQRVERVLEPELHFTYFLKDGIPTLHFSGLYIPCIGDILRVRYAAGYTIAGFEGEAVTTLPETFESALVNGTAAEACFLRAGSIAERYGTHPSEPQRLMEIGHLWRETFVRNLTGLKVIQDFGFPPGFALDLWDRRTI
jgi:hypothetical protein